MRHVAGTEEPSGSADVFDSPTRKRTDTKQVPMNSERQDQLLSLRKRGHFSLSGRKKEDRMISGLTIMEKNGRKVEMFLVIDGHGGSDVATFLQERLPTVLQSMCRERFESLDLEFLNYEGWSSLLTESFANCNETWDRTASTISELKAGAVVTLVLLCDKACLVAHVGDAKVVVQSGTESKDLTPFHRCDVPEERERIEKCGGIVFNNRVRGVLAPSRAFGDVLVRTDRNGRRNDEIIKPVPHICRCELDYADCIVIATDGLFDVFPADAVAKAAAHFLHRIPDADRAARFLAENAAMRTDDDITVIVIGRTDQGPEEEDVPESATRESAGAH